jgi:glycosyltransferase involved in cell wall biosynthesis
VWAKTHDWLASSWIEHLPPPTKPTILHCFDGSSMRTLAKAKSKGFVTVYESTIPPMLVNMLIEERRRLGLRISQGWYAQSQRWEEHLSEECLLADYCLVQSWANVDALMKIGIPASKIILLSLGVDTERFYPPVAPRSVSPFRVLFVGQIALRKGLQYLLEAWKQLNIPDAELVLAGYVNKDDGGIELLASYQGYYKWLGFVLEELPQVYQSADVFVLPSLSEGASMATIEALSSGLPCITTKNVGCVLRDGMEGFVVPIGDIGSLKHRIRQLYDDPELRQRMGGVARARAERLTWQEYGRRLTLVYQLILNGERESASDVLNMVDL